MGATDQTLSKRTRKTRCVILGTRHLRAGKGNDRDKVRIVVASLRGGCWEGAQNNPSSRTLETCGSKKREWSLCRDQPRSTCEALINYLRPSCNPHDSPERGTILEKWRHKEVTWLRLYSQNGEAQCPPTANAEPLSPKLHSLLLPG